MRWQLILEEFSSELIYIRGSKNIVADALKCLNKIDNLNNTNINFNYNNNNNNNYNKVEPILESLWKNLALNKEDVLHRTSFKNTMRFQQKDQSLIEIAKEKPNDHAIKVIHRVGKIYFLNHDRHGKIMIPKQIQNTL